MRNHLKTINLKAGSLLRRFQSDARGNVAIITALVALPLFIAAGVAIDVARSSRSENALQVAVDAAALAIGASEKANMAGLSSAEKAARKQELKQMAEKFVKANYRDEGGDVTVDVDITDEFITVEGRKIYPTTLMNLAGIRDVNLSARAEVNTQGGIAENIEIVLVMDTTGSMRDYNRLVYAKAAAMKLLQTVLGDARSHEKLRFALVPFSGSVNVGADKLASGWIDTTGKATVSKVNFTDPTYHNMKGWDDLKYRNSKWQLVKLQWNGCVEARLGDLALNDTPPSAASPNTLFTPYFAPDEPDKNGYGNSYLFDANNGTDEERLKNQNKYANQIVDTSEPDKGPWRSCAASPIVPLTDSRDAIEAGIEKMEPRGSTMLPEGIMWGWRVLSPEEPYVGQPFTDKKWRKVVVFMTDGENDVGTNKSWQMPPATIGTLYTSYGYGATKPVVKNRFGTTTQSQARPRLDQKFLKACTDLKAKAELRENPKDRSQKIPSVELYTIAFQAPDSVKDDLRACATNASYYVEADDGEQLLLRFEAIGARLRTLYLSK